MMAFMPRALRPDIADGYHHVMNRGIDHADVFFDDSDRVEIGQRLADVCERFGIRTLAYCLMDNHFHVLVYCPDGGLSDAMQRLSSMYTRHVNDRLGRDGPLFRGRFHSRLVTDERQLITTVRYIHRNPLDLPGVVRARDYRWSSHRTYLGLRRTPEWLSTSPVMDGWEPAAFDRFVDGDLCGPDRVDAAGLRAMVEAAELVLAERGAPADTRLGAVARKIVLAWATATTAADGEVLMEVFAMPTPGALRKASLRARSFVRADRECSAVLMKVLDLVAGEWDNTGLTRVVPYSAARAAS
jgi:REP element-mobilizing transposase RayT